MPFDGAIEIQGGPRLLYPHTFTSQYDPTIEPESYHYRKDAHLIYRYTNYLDGVNPGGYSGAPVWMSVETKEAAIWAAKPAIVGIVVEHFKKSNLIMAVRIKHLVELLASDKTIVCQESVLLHCFPGATRYLEG